MDDLIRLVSQLEERLLFVDSEAVWRASRAAEARPASRRQLQAQLAAAVDEGLLFTDARLQLDSASGRLESVHLFRVNRHHPRVARALRAR